ncbi:hypothetical protein CCP3SC15_4680003 [Gammaproteobacteria bacterium]
MVFVAKSNRFSSHNVKIGKQILKAVKGFDTVGNVIFVARVAPALVTALAAGVLLDYGR